MGLCVHRKPGRPAAPAKAGRRGRAKITDEMRKAAASGFSTATDLADWLVRTLKMPFREAHHQAGRLVRKAIEAIIDEQEARAKASWGKLTHPQIYGLLVGTHSPAGSWEFLNGELTSLKVDSVTFKGHCVLTELTLNLVGKSASSNCCSSTLVALHC